MEYKGIFKSTFLFGFVQVARMLVLLVKNKVVAIVLGPEGMGLISIYNNVVNLTKTGASLGVSQSAVRDVSEANSQNDIRRFSKIIKVTNRVVYFTSLLGLFATIVLAPFFSKWNFGNYSYTISFLLLSTAVAADVFSENQLAIIKGMRQLRNLAKASLYGTIVAIILGLPLILIMGEQGIVPSIIVSAISTALVSSYYAKKIEYKKNIFISAKETFSEAKPMVKMGIALMISNFLAFLFRLIVAAYIRSEGGLEDVGFYNAGMTLVNMYFSMVTTALTTDYYPRISACNHDNKRLFDEIRTQSTVGLVMFFPLMTIFVFFSSVIINILYSYKFLIAIEYTNVAIIGMLISVVSDCYGYIFIAKQDSKLYFWLAVIFNVVLLPIYLSAYKYFGLTGLGWAYTLNNLSQLIVYLLLCRYRHKIDIDYSVLLRLVIVITAVVLMVMLTGLDNILLKNISGGACMILSLIISYLIMVYHMNINPLNFIKLKRKK